MEEDDWQFGVDIYSAGNRMKLGALLRQYNAPSLDLTPMEAGILVESLSTIDCKEEIKRKYGMTVKELVKKARVEGYNTVGEYLKSKGR